MSTLVQIILVLLVILLVIGGYGAARRQRARKEHGKGPEGGSVKNSDQ